MPQTIANEKENKKIQQYFDMIVVHSIFCGYINMVVTKTVRKYEIAIFIYTD